MNKALKYIIVVAVFVGLGFGLYCLVSRPRVKTAAETAAPPEATVNVVLMTIAPSTIPDAILLPASVAPAKSVTVPVEIAGTVEWLGVEEGTQVMEGQEIAKIDTRTLQAELDRAKANYDLAESDFHRAEKLAAEKVSSPEQFDQAKSQLEVQKALLDTAKLNLDKSTVRAPLAGVLNRRYIERGEYVKVGDVIADIVKVDRVKVVVEMPEKDIQYVTLGTLLGVVLDQSLETVIPEHPQGTTLAEAIMQAVSDRKVILGAVTYRSVVADAMTRTYRVEVEVANSDLKLLPGMIVRAAVLRRMIENAVAVPLIAVVPRDGRAAAYVEENGRARERTVKLGVTDGRNIEILEGLAAGDRLIVEGQRQLKDGTLLKVVEGQGAQR